MTSKLGRPASVEAVLPSGPDGTQEQALELPCGNGERVLLVEDEEEHRLAVQRMLERLGYEVHTAADADEALTLLRTGAVKIDAVLTDLLMPGTMNGSELAAQIDDLSPGLKVMILSGYPVRMRPQLESNHSWLEKPVTLENLAKALREALERS